MNTRRGFFRLVVGLVAVATTGLAGCLRKPKTWPQATKKYQPFVTMGQIGDDGKFMETTHIYAPLTIEDFNEVIRRVRERELDLIRLKPRSGPTYVGESKLRRRMRKYSDKPSVLLERLERQTKGIRV